MLDAAAALRDMDAVLEVFNHLKHEAQYDDLSDQGEERLLEVATLLAHTIGRFAPDASEFRKRADEAMDRYAASDPRIAVMMLAGILKSLRTSYKSGYLQSIQALIHADVFADFLEMADYLLSEGYKDAAAVITGGVLEEHLRKLAGKHGIALSDAAGKPRKAASLNDDLVKSTAYDKLEQKNVTAWLDLRNKAAHGDYGSYDKQHVEHLVLGVRSFVARYSA